MKPISKNSLNEAKPVSQIGAGTGLGFVIAGPGGTGKSWFLGTMAEHGRTLLIATLPREIKSVKYREYAVDHLLIYDQDWMPTLGRFKAHGFVEFLNLMDELYNDDTYENIIIDSGTELAELAWHYAMMAHGVATPAEMQDSRSRWLPYEQLDIYLDQAVKSAMNLTIAGKRPKNVGFSWHIQPAKDDQIDTKTGGVKKSADHAGEGVEYEGTVLPLVRGKFRRRLMNLVDCYLLTELQRVTVDVNSLRRQGNLGVAYKLQIRANPERHIKLPWLVPADQSYINNDWGELLAMAKGAEPDNTETSTEVASKGKAATARRTISKVTR